MKTHIKKAAIALGFLALAFGANAQFNIRGGFGAGIVTGPVRIEDIGNRFTEVIEGKTVSGFEAGFFLKAQAGPIYLKPMAMYGFRYGTVSYNSNESADPKDVNFALHKLEFPVLLGVKFLGPFYIEGGPAYNYIFSVTNQYGTNIVDVTQGALGYRVGLGAELGPVILSVNYGGATYRYSGNRATFKEPYKLIFGLGIILGDGPDLTPDRNPE